MIDDYFSSIFKRTCSSDLLALLKYFSSWKQLKIHLVVL